MTHWRCVKHIVSINDQTKVHENIMALGACCVKWQKLWYDQARIIHQRPLWENCVSYCLLSRLLRLANFWRLSFFSKKKILTTYSGPLQSRLTQQRCKLWWEGRKTNTLEIKWQAEDLAEWCMAAFGSLFASTENFFFKLRRYIYSTFHQIIQFQWYYFSVKPE